MEVKRRSRAVCRVLAETIPSLTTRGKVISSGVTPPSSASTLGTKCKSRALKPEPPLAQVPLQAQLPRRTLAVLKAIPPPVQVSPAARLASREAHRQQFSSKLIASSMFLAPAQHLQRTSRSIPRPRASRAVLLTLVPAHLGGIREYQCSDCLISHVATDESSTVEPWDHNEGLQRLCPALQ